MLTKKQLKEAREQLQQAQNPVFLYDNDADGLCSFLLLRRWLGRGSGIAIRSYPDLDESYAKKVAELNPDAIIVLDKPVLSQKFVDAIHDLGIPFIWIDHHDVGLPEMHEGMTIYNPALNKGKQKSSEPVTYICYAITERKEDLWLAVAGCIADHYLPKFASDFAKERPEFWGRVKEPFDAYFGTEIGNIAMAFNFGVKDKAMNIESMQNFLISCRGPGDVLAESVENSGFRDHVLSMKKKFESLLEEAERYVQGKALFFEYGGDTSISTEISNALSHKYKGMYIAVAFKRGGIANVSMRGKNVKKILSEILPKIENSTGGGHTDAVGARIPLVHLDKFKELFLVAVN